VLYAIARVNFLFDTSMDPHMRADDLCSLFGVSQGRYGLKLCMGRIEQAAYPW
jgi:hypothetical protein